MSEMTDKEYFDQPGFDQIIEKDMLDSLRSEPKSEPTIEIKWVNLAKAYHDKRVELLREWGVKDAKTWEQLSPREISATTEAVKYVTQMFVNAVLI